MDFNIETIPCLSDNYAFVITEAKSKKAILIDAPESQPLINYLDAHEFNLEYILLTHHHDDHVQGVSDLVKKYGSKVIGGRQDEHRLPKLDILVKENDNLKIFNLEFKIIDVPGHTVGHIAFYCEKIKALFSGDSLMAMGCGRLFEGTPEQMWNSLSELANLPPETMVYSGHEYTENNARFCLSLERNNEKLKVRMNQIEKLRASNVPTVPSLLNDELQTNTFLRANVSEVKKALNLSSSSSLEAFTEIRKRKDNF